MPLRDEVRSTRVFSDSFPKWWLWFRCFCVEATESHPLLLEVLPSPCLHGFHNLHPKGNKILPPSSSLERSDKMSMVSSRGSCLGLLQEMERQKRTLHFVSSFAAAVVNIIYFYQYDILTWDLKDRVRHRWSFHGCYFLLSSTAKVLVFT